MGIIQVLNHLQSNGAAWKTEDMEDIIKMDIRNVVST
jgi:hypothetical protein